MSRPRPIEIAALAVAAAAIASRLVNAFAIPALRDFDGAGHALNAFAVYSGALPDPRSWSGFHPPLSALLGAALWRLAPDALPVHVLLRLLSLATGVLAVALVARALARYLPRPDTVVVATLVFCAPVTAIATSTLGNESLCMLGVTGVLARLLRGPGSRPLRHAVVVGALAGLATLAKSTGLLAVAAAAAGTAFRLRHRPRTAAACAGLMLVVAGAAVAPHYARLLTVTDGSLRGVVSGGVGSPDAAAAMATQPPGERHALDYLRFPRAALLAPSYLEPGMLGSVPGLLYASTWADGHAVLLPAALPAARRAQAATALAGLVPTALALLGVVRILRRPRDHADWLGPGLFAAALLLGFAFQAWSFPHYSTVKASYLLPAVLPAGYALGVGLGGLPGRWRSAARLWLLVLATGSTALCAYGWWT